MEVTTTSNVQWYYQHYPPAVNNNTLHTLSIYDSMKIWRFDIGNEIQIFSSTYYLNKHDKLLLDNSTFC